MTERGSRWALLVAALLAAGSARAEDRAASVVAVYADDDGVTVVSPTVTGAVEVGAARLDARITLDIISAASVDLVTAASPRGFEEVRTEASAGVAWDFGRGHGIGAGYTVSIEPDFETHSLGLSHTIDLLDRRATLGVGYGFAHSTVGRAHDRSFERTRSSHRGDVTWTHALSRTVALDVMGGATWTQGFQASPYRFVRLYAPDATLHATAVAEAVPDQRLRGVAVARVRAQLVPDVFLLGEYRLYGDTWGVHGHTGTLRIAGGLADDRLTLAGRVRGYYQGGASFYRRRYEAGPTLPRARTADKELGPMASVTGGVSAQWTFVPALDHALRLGLSVDVVRFEYLDHLFLDGRTGAIAVLDLTWEH